ncbi:hypothetical protein CCMSSC00406_0004113 [Pleurotus cornucopiae]|uniref:Uncharacterized protein n=1 Tax=Pleurotus cornucopiae TaxID=5321 RepID=A0ACB7J9T6_PLECO|nr:hypothetical protein CCMSSC00406_0004113 [Pleurotus cornucopiae]
MAAVELGRLHPVHTALSRNSDGVYTLKDLDARAATASYTRDELISFVSANRRIIQGSLTDPLSLPPRYIAFATLYNKQFHVTTKFNVPHGHAFPTRLAGPGLRFLGLVAARPLVPRRNPRDRHQSQAPNNWRTAIPPNHMGQSRPMVGQSSSRRQRSEAGEFVLTAERHDVVTNLLLDMVMGKDTSPVNSPPVRESPAVRRGGASLRRPTQQPGKRHNSTPYARPQKICPIIVPTKSSPDLGSSPIDQKISGLPTADDIPNADKPRDTVPINTCPSPSDSDIELVNTPSSVSSELTTTSEDVDMHTENDKSSDSPTSKVPTVELADLSISKDSAIAESAK